MAEKVEVLTVESATFRRFHWWSNWIDVCVFTYDGSGYLLQMQVSRTNQKRFTSVPMKRWWGLANPGIGFDLTQMKKFEKPLVENTTASKPEAPQLRMPGCSS